MQGGMKESYFTARARVSGLAPTFSERASSRNQAFVRMILNSLYNYLETTYDIECPHDINADTAVSLRQVDAFLAFRSDPTLEYLKRALARVEGGTYGICLGCKRSMGQDLLEADPGRCFCPECETRLNLQRACESRSALLPADDVDPFW